MLMMLKQYLTMTFHKTKNIMYTESVELVVLVEKVYLSHLYLEKK
ncbi:hypothetical protein SDC9_190887 [bioreactor metagenome]|uniref:Uncharacterized protein n=1 Tax=bioreactor metagenome TaxID=1076179 RepID=A0A645HWD7_9ZZZZ